MRVLHVFPALSPELGGPSEVAFGLVPALIARGVEVEVAATSWGLPELQQSDLCNYRDMPVHFFSPSRFASRQYIPSQSFAAWLSREVKNFDIIDFHYLFVFSTTIGAYYARKFGVPYLLHSMGQLAPWALSQSTLRKSVYSVLFERRMLNGAAGIHSSSPGEAEDIKNFGVRAPVYTVPLGVSLPQKVQDAGERLRRAHAIPEGRNILLFLSRLHPKKRLEELLRAISVSEHPAHLLIAGGGERSYEASLKQLAAELNISERVTWLGFVSGEEKQLLLSGADVFVLPSYSENFGISVAEALAAGLPVIVSRGVQIASLIEESQAGLVVEADLEGLPQAIDSLLSQETLRTQMGLNAEEFAAKELSWNRVAKEYEDIYAKVLSHTKRGVKE